VSLSLRAVTESQSRGMHAACGAFARSAEGPRGAQPQAPYVGTGAPASPESSFHRRKRSSISLLTR